ncbi:ribosomal protein L5 domain-containing protein [Zopfochytrium polystomum]|nr:ribosomal protein L5 domain-containing protein [Zopfochytrium polystomum]
MDALDAVPVIRPRLETHLYETLMDDILVLLYCHDSPLAPSIAALDAESETKRIESPRPAALRQVFSVPLGQLPTSPYSLNGITSNLLTAESNRQIVRPVRQGWRPVMKNPIDYTTVRKKQFARFFRRIDRNAILRARAFEKYFSPKPQHLPVVKKVSLRVWDEKAIDNKNILIGAIMSLSSITGLPATPLFSTAADAAKKIRVGMPLGAAVEVHGSRAYEFLDKLIHVVLPRLREWSGVKVELKRPFRATVQSGVIRFKIPEAAVGAFPDIEPHFDMYPRLFDLEVSIHTSAGNRRHAALLLSGMQMPIEVVETAKAEKAKSTDPFAMFRRRDRNTGRIIRAGAKAKPAKAKKK